MLGPLLAMPSGQGLNMTLLAILKVNRANWLLVLEKNWSCGKMFLLLTRYHYWSDNITPHPCKGPPCLTWTQWFRTWLTWSNQETMVYTYIYILIYIYIYSYIIHIISNIMEWYPIWSIFRSNLPQAPQPRLERLGTIQRPASRIESAGRSRGRCSSQSYKSPIMIYN